MLFAVAFATEARMIMQTTISLFRFAPVLEATPNIFSVARETKQNALKITQDLPINLAKARTISHKNEVGLVRAVAFS